MKRCCLLFFIIIIKTNLYGQIIKLDIKDNDERPKSINEVIRELGGDTVEFFYNDRYQMVKPNCATKFRISKVDPTLAFSREILLTTI